MKKLFYCLLIFLLSSCNHSVNPFDDGEPDGYYDENGNWVEWGTEQNNPSSTIDEYSEEVIQDIEEEKPEQKVIIGYKFRVSGYYSTPPVGSGSGGGTGYTSCEFILPKSQYSADQINGMLPFLLPQNLKDYDPSYDYSGLEADYTMYGTAVYQ